MDSVKTLNACGSCITMNLIRMAIIGTGRKPEAAFMHPMQVVQVLALAEAIALAECHDQSERGMVARKMVTESPIMTIAGIPIAQAPDFRNDIIEFRDEQGIISRIENLARPIALSFMNAKH